MSAPAPCLGLGKVFGHKWVKSGPLECLESPYCFRCGMPKGGWRK